MIRHACGYKLANDGKDTRAIQLYMGHRNIQNTVGYTQLSAEKFKDFWVDCRSPAGGKPNDQPGRDKGSYCCI